MGFAADHRLWAAQVPTICARNTFITFDNRGVGRSTGEPIETLEEMADDAAALLDHLGIERAVILGVSMGGAIAQHLALRHPERVKALGLIVTFARPIEYTRRESRLGHELLRLAGPKAFLEATLIHLFTPRFFEIGEEALNQVIAAYFYGGEAEIPDPAVLEGQMRAIAKHDLLDSLGAIACPTLVVGGRLDMMVPGFASEEIAAAIPGAELHMFDSGHALMFEEMDAFNALLRDFLDRTA
jgi:pimeloyl-ACP methyl ester carboxylesterase